MTGPHLVGLSFHSPLSLPPPVPTSSRFVPLVPSALTCREWTYVFGGSMTSYLFPKTLPNPPFANLKELESLPKHSSSSQQHQYINIKPIRFKLWKLKRMVSRNEKCDSFETWFPQRVGRWRCAAIYEPGTAYDVTFILDQKCWVASTLYVRISRTQYTPLVSREWQDNKNPLQRRDPFGL